MSWVPAEKSAKTQTTVGTEVGRVFHNLGIATGNMQSPRVARRVDGTSNDEVSTDLKWQRAVTVVLCRLSASYCVAVPWRQQYTRTRSQNWIHSGTINQDSSRSSGIMGSDFLTEKTSGAAAFKIDCNLSISMIKQVAALNTDGHPLEKAVNSWWFTEFYYWIYLFYLLLDFYTAVTC